MSAPESLFRMQCSEGGCMFSRHSSIAQWQSIRLLTEGLLVRAQLGELLAVISHDMAAFFIYMEILPIFMIL